jgi:heme exporter protein C
MNISKIANLKFFYTRTRRVSFFLSSITLILFCIGVYWGLFIAPADYLQGDSYRIMYVHVPAAWLSLQTYMIMALTGFIALVWKIKIMEIASIQCAPIGAIFTIIALVTGMVWGKPTWGTYWVWDARLTSELILLFLYIGIMVLYSAYSDKRQAIKMTSLLAIIGLINIPIIHYSVEWWNTLHQGPTVTKFEKPSAHITMLLPLLYMFFVFNMYFLSILIKRMRLGIYLREKNNKWMEDLKND